MATKRATAAEGTDGTRLGQKCCHAILAILTEYSATHPGKKLNQYQIIKLAKQHLKQSGIKVGSAADFDKEIDDSTLKRYAKTVPIFYYSMEFGELDFTLKEWKWLATKVFGGKKSQVKIKLMSILTDFQQLRDGLIKSRAIQKETHEIKRELHDLKVKDGVIPPSRYPPPEFVPADELDEIELKIAYWNKVLAFFPS